MAGLIRYERGRIEITDRPGLEAVSFECHGSERRACNRLIRPPEGAEVAYWR
jgi:hypothetical protein